jgi:putative nucleotidyltransferase with HDIG domain
MGADDYMIKPIDLVELGISVRRNIQKVRLIRENRRYQHNLEETVEERTAKLHQALIEIKDTYQSTLEALAAALDAREHETGCHSHRVMLFTVELARRLGVPEEKIAGMARGALLHDIGKIGIVDRILLKPSELNEQEWTQMRRHPEIGYQILKAIPYLEDARDIVLNHQERWDGLGYPQGLQGEETPLGARLFAVVDAFDAMTSDRPYRAALPYTAAREEIRRCSGTQLDREAVESFLSVPEEVWIRLRQATWQAPTECSPLIRSFSPRWALMGQRAR